MWRCASERGESTAKRARGVARGKGARGRSVGGGKRVGAAAEASVDRGAQPWRTFSLKPLKSPAFARTPQNAAKPLIPSRSLLCNIV
eukprot:853744-Pleurochrysis_carterae.AAC.2